MEVKDMHAPYLKGSNDHQQCRTMLQQRGNDCLQNQSGTCASFNFSQVLVTESYRICLKMDIETPENKNNQNRQGAKTALTHNKRSELA